MLWCVTSDGYDRENTGRHGDGDVDSDVMLSRDLHIPGRIVLNLWRVVNHMVTAYSVYLRHGGIAMLS